MNEPNKTGMSQVNLSISQAPRRRWARGLLASAAIGLAITASAMPATASAKMSPSEPFVPVHPHTEWPAPGPVHPNDDPCSVGGPGAGASEGCDDESGIDDPGSGGTQWGGPGERIAVGRDMDIEAAQDEAEAEANDVCHGDWDRRDFVWTLDPPNPAVYTLTYECS